MKEVIRVGVMNNFEHTQSEYDHLKAFTKDGRSLFVNSSGKTTLRSDLPSIVTVNPDVSTFVPLKGNTSNVKALRVKTYPDLNVLDFILMKYPTDIPILLTGMRFRSQASLDRFVSPSEQGAYTWKGNWFRLEPEAWKLEMIHWSSYTGLWNPVYVCDETGKGCPDCMNCSYLTYGTKDVELKGLNLSTSGDGGKCTRDCPDCFARSLLEIGTGWPKLNSIMKNNKQKGKNK